MFSLPDFTPSACVLFFTCSLCFKDCNIFYFLFYFYPRNKCKNMKLLLKLEFRIKPNCECVTDILTHTYIYKYI